MFLLILLSGNAQAGVEAIFTFHDVSINTMEKGLKNWMMFSFTFHDVSINTSHKANDYAYVIIFTFHDVSINTRSSSPAYANTIALHSTMFLLIPVVYSSLQYRYNLTTFCQSCHFIIFILIFIFLDSSHF